MLFERFGNPIKGLMQADLHQTSRSSYSAVLPFVHKGMDKVLPRGGSIPQTGQEVQMLVGEPLDFCDLHARSKVHLALVQLCAQNFGPYLQPVPFDSLSCCQLVARHLAERKVSAWPLSIAD